jgi:hypothetical protein
MAVASAAVVGGAELDEERTIGKHKANSDDMRRPFEPRYLAVTRIMDVLITLRNRFNPRCHHPALPLVNEAVERQIVSRAIGAPKKKDNQYTELDGSSALGL